MEELNGVEISVGIISSKQAYDVIFFYRLLTELPIAVGLTALGPPIIYSFPSVHVPTENGLTGVNVMVQSHVAFHSWPEQGYIHLTISSCKPVNEAHLLGFLEEAFGVREVNLKSLSWR